MYSSNKKALIKLAEKHIFSKPTSENKQARIFIETLITEIPEKSIPTLLKPLQKLYDVPEDIVKRNTRILALCTIVPHRTLIQKTVSEIKRDIEKSMKSERTRKKFSPYNLDLVREIMLEEVEAGNVRKYLNQENFYLELDAIDYVYSLY